MKTQPKAPPRVYDMATPPNMPRFPGTALEAHSEAGQGRPRPGGARTPQWHNGWPPSGKPDLKLVAEMARLYGKSDIVSFDIEGEWQHTHKMPREQFDAAVTVKIDTLKAANDANPRAQFGVYATIPHDPYLMTGYAIALDVKRRADDGETIPRAELPTLQNYPMLAKQFDHWQETCRACTDLAKISDFATFVGYSTGKSDNESNDIRNDGVALSYGIAEAKRFGRAVYVYLSPYLDGELNNGPVGERRFQASCEKAKSLNVNAFIWFYTNNQPLNAYETACMKIAVKVFGKSR